MKINADNLNINLRHIRALHSIAQLGTFSAAAASLGIVPSALSEVIRQLEAQNTELARKLALLDVRIPDPPQDGPSASEGPTRSE